MMRNNARMRTINEKKDLFWVVKYHTDEAMTPHISSIPSRREFWWKQYAITMTVTTLVHMFGIVDYGAIAFIEDSEIQRPLWLGQKWRQKKVGVLPYHVRTDLHLHVQRRRLSHFWVICWCELQIFRHKKKIVSQILSWSKLRLGNLRLCAKIWQIQLCKHFVSFWLASEIFCSDNIEWMVQHALACNFLLLSCCNFVHFCMSESAISVDKPNQLEPSHCHFPKKKSCKWFQPISNVSIITLKNTPNLKQKQWIFLCKLWISNKNIFAFLPKATLAVTNESCGCPSALMKVSQCFHFNSISKAFFHFWLWFGYAILLWPNISWFFQ